jgi:Double zinc ribbon
MTPRRTTFAEELAIVPKFMYLFIPLSFACMMFVFLVYMPGHDPHSPPFPLRVFLSVLTGVVLSIYFGLIGYVNQDAKRRDMGQVLWTLLVIFVPNGLGFLAYFLLRKPLIQYCPQCGERIDKGFHFCAKCGCELAPTCGSCGQAVSRDFVVCPYCGKALKGAASV